MIRINLLPVREARQKQAGQKIIALAVAVIVLELGVLVWYQGVKQTELDEIQRQNGQLSSKIADLQKQTKEVATLESKRTELEQQKQVLDTLVEGQSGPVKMLYAMSEMLTPVEDPQRKLEMLERGWNPDWDPRRLWIAGFNEQKRGVKMAGIARTNEDLAEFLQRLQSSKHFVDIALNFSEAIELPGLNNARLIRFDVDAKVLYGPADVKRLAAGTLGPTK